MVPKQRFRDQEDFSEALRLAQDIGFRCLEEERRQLLKISIRQKRIIRNLVESLSGFTQYNLVYLGQGYWQVNFFAWNCHERSVRETLEQKKPHERDKVRVNLIKRRKREGKN